MSDESSTFNVFASKNGYSVHFKISVADVKHAEDEPAFMALLKAAEWLLRDMKEKGYEHDTLKDRPGGARKSAPAKVVNEAGEEVKCGDCNGPVYDNRQRNKERLAKGERPMPEFKCRDESCGWKQWPRREEVA